MKTESCSKLYSDIACLEMSGILPLLFPALSFRVTKKKKKDGQKKLLVDWHNKLRLFHQLKVIKFK